MAGQRAPFAAFLVQSDRLPSAWTVQEQNRLLELCFELPRVHKAWNRGRLSPSCGLYQSLRHAPFQSFVVPIRRFGCRHSQSPVEFRCSAPRRSGKSLQNAQNLANIGSIGTAINIGTGQSEW